MLLIHFTHIEQHQDIIGFATFVPSFFSFYFAGWSILNQNSKYHVILGLPTYISMHFFFKKKLTISYIIIVPSSLLTQSLSP